MAPRGAVLGSAALVAGWYASATYMGVSNKALIAGHGFRFPGGLTFLHMAASGAVSAGAARWGASRGRDQHLKSLTHLGKVALLAGLFCAAVLAGNASLQFIPLSFTQMVGAATPLFTAAVLYLSGGGGQTRQELLALAPVVLGALMTAFGEVNFDARGFSLACFACLCRACKSVWQGRLLAAEEERLDSLHLMAYMCPLAAGFLAVFALPGEVRPFLAWADAFRADESRSSPAFLAFLASNVAAAFLVNILGFEITRRFGAVALQVLGNGKGAVTTIGGILVFRNTISATAGGGYGLTLLGVGLYGRAGRRARAQKARSPLPPPVEAGGAPGLAPPLRAKHKHKLSGRDLEQVLGGVVVEPGVPGSPGSPGRVPGRAKRRATDPGGLDRPAAAPLQAL